MNFVITSISDMQLMPLGVGHASYNAWLRNQANGLHTHAGAFFQNNFGFSVTWERLPNKSVQTHGWIMGYDNHAATPPIAVIEGSILHALTRVEQHILSLQLTTQPAYVEIIAGNDESQRAFENWMNYGTLRLQSGCASDIVDCLYRLVEILPCALIARAPSENASKEVKLTGHQSGDVIYATATRMVRAIGPEAWQLWGEQIARLSWTAEETKTRLKQSYQEDEKRTISLLATTGSTACNIYQDMKLSRKVIKEALRRLKRSRFNQVTLATIVCGTRFKFFEDDRRYPVRCEVTEGFQEEDSSQHLLSCCRMPLNTMINSPEEEIIHYLATLACKATTENPGMPTPNILVQDGELELEFPPSPIRPGGEISF